MAGIQPDRGSVRRHPYGPAAWLVDEVGDPVAWAAGLASLDLDGVIEIVPAETTVLVRCDRSRRDAVGEQLHLVVGVESPITSAATVTIEVVYDGADLAEVAERTGLTVAEVVERHVAGRYRVAFCGFSPGFAYLHGLDPALHLDRRSSPRTRVPAGSVAIAAGYSSVYPSASPGGWHLLGTTAAVVWDAGRADPALLRPGTGVQFRRAAA